MRSIMVASTLACVILAFCSGVIAAEPEGVADFSPPVGYQLVADDNCGTEHQPHVVVGTRWLYPPEMVEASDEHRAIIFDNNACELCYANPNPKASYKVDVVYVDNGGRSQRLEANGHPVHVDRPLPVNRPGRFLFDVPAESYADGKPLALKFIRVTGANAIVSYVRIWSTDKTLLEAVTPAPRPVSRPKPLWETDGPVEADWIFRDRLMLNPVGDAWEDPAEVVRDRLAPCIERQLRRGVAVADDLRCAGVDPSQVELEALARAATCRDALTADRSFDPVQWKAVYLDVRRAVRRLAFSHPLLVENDGLLFVRRHHADFPHQCSRRRSRYNRMGGDIRVLRHLDPDRLASAESITQGRFPEGLFGRPDVSFDGRRIVFGFAAADVKDLEEPLCLSRGRTDSIGNGTFYQVWEMVLDVAESTPRRITRGVSRREESTDPIYLPDGRIAFMSPRAGGMVQCGDWAWADCMFTVNPDGSDPRQITRSKEGEWDPCLMDDGTITFTRWEYVMRFWRPTQLIWNAHPDGTNPRVIGGYLTEERNYARCRQIPETSKVACIEAHHHNDGSGNLLMVDLRYGRDTPEGETLVVAGACDSPYPLDENFFLLSYDPRGVGASDRRTAGQVAIYLADVHGGLELVHREPELSAMYPTLIRPRRKPPVLTSEQPEAEEPHGTFFVQDVHRELPESMRGKARYLRVVEAHQRLIHTSPCNIWVGMGGFETKTVLGTVPVESDGSACFRVPAGRAVFFSVLDENHEALHTMRMTTDLKPGEYAGCVGCHEPSTSAPMLRRVSLALRREPSELEPPPWGVRTFGFPQLVQPILDRHCVACHDGGSETRKSFDLQAGRVAQTFAPNVWTTMGTDYKRFYTYPAYWALLPHVAHADIHRYQTPPGSWGSRVSPLIELLADDHYDVKLAPEEWRILRAWIDCNIPYLNDYRKFAVDPEIRRACP